MLRAVLFKSHKRFDAFKAAFEESGVTVAVLDFADPGWWDYDFAEADIVVYYPSFQFSSNHPQAISRVRDDLGQLHQLHPHLLIYPDANLYSFYNDKYTQYLFLTKTGFPVPRTIPLVSARAVDEAAATLGYPIVVKNRYGAGGDFVFRVESERELRNLFKLSQLDLLNEEFVLRGLRSLFQRETYYHLLKARQAKYPLLSPPLIAQEFLTIQKDLKLVVVDGEVVEGHWRLRANRAMWKVNIDGGGVGVWSNIPTEALAVGVELAERLQARWLNIDVIFQEDGFLISEFSPVWHHYRYKEKESFRYEQDYNLPMPLLEALDLERLLVKSLIGAVEEKRQLSSS